MTKRERAAVESLDAIRLALEAAANDKSAVAVIRTLVAGAPTGDGSDTGSVRRLLRAIKWTRKARFRVSP